MGIQWAYRPTNEHYKSGGRMIEILIESRAKGGTFLLNLGPKPNGELPIQQEDRMREIAAWTFINQESIYEVRPWIITNEYNIWFTKAKNESTVYAYLTKIPNWTRGDRKEFVLKSVMATDNTEISVLGQSGELVEYNPSADATARYEQTDEGLSISVVRAQRIYNDHKWPNPIVVKLTNVEPALDPPFVQTVEAKVDGSSADLKGELVKNGDKSQCEVGFRYRPYAGFAENLTGGPWIYSELEKQSKLGTFSVKIEGLEAGVEYEYRSIVRHPKIEIEGEIKRFRAE